MIVRDDELRAPSGGFVPSAPATPARCAGRQLSSRVQRTTTLDVERLVDRLVARSSIDSSSGKSTRSRLAICSGLYDRGPAAVLAAPVPRADPPHLPGPDRAMPLGRLISPASHYHRRPGAAGWQHAGDLRGAQHAGRRATGRSWPDTPSARHGSRRCGAAPWRWSEGDRPAACGLAHPDLFGRGGWRSLLARRTTGSGPDSGARPRVGMPPPSRNQRDPTAGDTPAATPASSLVRTRWRSPTRTAAGARVVATGGRPGERIAGRPARSAARRFLGGVPSQPLTAKVLRRPVESALADPASEWWTSSPRMMGWPCWPRAPGGHAQREQDQLGRPGAHGVPADDALGVDVHHEGDVADPAHVRAHR